MEAEALQDQQYRLEDYITLAKEGAEVAVEIQLRKQAVLQRVHPAETANMTGEISMYLLVGEFTLTAKGETHKVSKVYAFGADGEGLDRAKVNRSIANERLKMDYRRLKEAEIPVAERYF